MTKETVSADRLSLHYVCGTPQQRAHFNHTALLLGHHCELYDDFSELATHAPRRGIIFLQDEPALGGISAGLSRLERLGVWLPVIAIGETRDPQQIVESIKAGAMDYIVLPLEADRLGRCLARNALEAETSAASRRKKVEAQERLGRLSRREAEVLDLLAHGCSNKLIARELGISPSDLPPSEWPNFYFRIGHEGGMEWRGSTSRKRSSASCVKRKSCWRRAGRWQMRAGGLALRSRATTAGARNMVA